MNESFYMMLSHWLKSHLENASLLGNIPKLGLMVTHCNSPVGVAFIRQIEGGKIGMIDGFLCDPDCKVETRTECLDALIIDLIQLAKKNGIEGLFATTVNKRVLARAKKLGFEITPHRVVSLKI
jgi:N-acetylglutamate synthase-like GNAT family acetyltransferase